MFDSLASAEQAVEAACRVLDSADLSSPELAEAIEVLREFEQWAAETKRLLAERLGSDGPSGQGSAGSAA
jgi:hypothetical protein